MLTNEGQQASHSSSSDVAPTCAARVTTTRCVVCHLHLRALLRERPRIYLHIFSNSSLCTQSSSSTSAVASVKNDVADSPSRLSSKPSSRSTLPRRPCLRLDRRTRRVDSVTLLNQSTPTSWSVLSMVSGSTTGLRAAIFSCRWCPVNYQPPCSASSTNNVSTSLSRNSTSTQRRHRLRQFVHQGGNQETKDDQNNNNKKQNNKNNEQKEKHWR